MGVHTGEVVLTVAENELVCASEVVVAGTVIGFTVLVVGVEDEVASGALEVCALVFDALVDLVVLEVRVVVEVDVVVGTV